MGGPVAAVPGGVEAPVLSCVMPTADRRAWVPRAIALFLAQDYGPRELVVVDDGADPVADLIPDDPRIGYERLPSRLPLGVKRNRGCQLARGELIAHWDDDDWYAPWRLRVQVEELLRAGTQLCGLSSLLFHDPETAATWRYVYPAGERRPWVAGASMLYRRTRWQRTPFEPVFTGEDTRLCGAVPRHEVTMLRRDDLVVATLHAGNSARKGLRGSRWHRVSPDVLPRGHEGPPGRAGGHRSRRLMVTRTDSGRA